MSRLHALLFFVLGFNVASAQIDTSTYGGRLQFQIENSPVFSRAFTGFMLLDPANDSVWCASNADRYFTPASNTKILTLATCLRLLGDSLVGMEYCIQDSTLFFRGTADPTFLNPVFAAYQPVYQQLRNWKGLRAYSADHYWEKPYGLGWCWDDVQDTYSAPRSPFPVFGNVCQVDTGLRVQPFGTKLTPVDARLFQQYFPNDDYDIGLTTGNNVAAFTLETPGGGRRSRTVGQEMAFPFSPNALGWQAIGDSLNFPISDAVPTGPVLWQKAYSWPVDSVYRRLMYESDNFVAEHLLLQAAWRRTDTLRERFAIKYARDSLLPASKTPPNWVDGSGLSRYNLVTPRYLTAVLSQLWHQQPRERLFSLFPAGGVSGTIAKLYAGDNGKPFVFAKTGTMSGVHCLSGYLVTRSGRVLVFSFMHNNFVGTNRPWKEEMARVLRQIWATA